MTSQSKHEDLMLVIEKGMIPIAILLGMFLRFWQLGGKNFWLDELGVANAAFQPTLSLALKAASEHIMAMPLDYVIAWIAARFSHAEGWLRLSEALWGCMLLPVGYKLSLKLSGSKRIASFTLLLLALSPILIMYSQELRFYSPLIFFFTVSTYVGLEAVRASRFGSWVTFTFITMVGIYFHLYMILAVGTVLLWLLPYFNKEHWTLRRNSFAISALVLAVAFLYGLFSFGGVYANHQLSLFEYESFSTFFFTGLGWFPAYPASITGWFLGIFMMLLAISGVGITIRKSPFGHIALLFYATVLQVMMIVVFDYLKNYPLFARQIVMFAPVMIFFSAIGVDWLIEQISAHFQTGPSTERLTGTWVILILLVTFPALNGYYQAQKGSMQQIRAILSDQWQTGQAIYAEAGVFEVFQYYWEQDSTSRPLANTLIPMDYTSTDGWGYPAPAWFVVNYPPQVDIKIALQRAGFTTIYIPESPTLHPQMLWRRP